MKRPSVLAAMLLLSTGLRAGDTASAPGTEAAQLAAKIHQSNQMEIHMGRLAAEKGHSPRVRRYGTLLIRDHLFSDRKLMDVAESRRIAIERLPADAKHASVMERLSRASGEEFDREFLAAMEDDHRAAIALLESAQPEEARVGRFIDTLLPILRQHEEIAANLRGAAAGGS